MPRPAEPQPTEDVIHHCDSQHNGLALTSLWPNSLLSPDQYLSLAPLTSTSHCCLAPLPRTITTYLCLSSSRFTLISHQHRSASPLARTCSPGLSPHLSPHLSAHLSPICRVPVIPVFLECGGYDFGNAQRALDDFKLYLDHADPGARARIEELLASGEMRSGCLGCCNRINTRVLQGA